MINLCLKLCMYGSQLPIYYYSDTVCVDTSLVFAYYKTLLALGLV